jgi:hypothetical protein
MNITLSADEKLVERARAYAGEHGTSLNQLIRDYLERLVGEGSAKDAATEFAAIARENAGDSHGERVTRADIYSARMEQLTREAKPVDVRERE